MDTAITAMYDASYRSRKKVVLAGLLSILILCIVWIAMPFTMARELSDPDDQGDWSEIHSMYYDFQQTVETELADGMFSSINAIYGEEDTDTANIVNRSLSNVHEQIEESDLYTNVAKALKGIAMFLVCLYAMFKMFAELSRGDGSTDMWAKVFVTVAIGLAVVINWDLILGALEQLGQYLMDRIGDAITKTEDVEGIRTWMDSAFGWGNNDMNDMGSYSILQIGEMVTGILENFWIGVWAALKMIGMCLVLIIFEVPLMAARIVLLTIMIELCVRKAFFPLAIADVAGNGARSPGIGYMKKLVALYIRIGMCYIVAAVGNIVVNAVLTTTPDNVLEGFLWLLCIFVAYTTCTKLYTATSSIANQVVGQG